MRVLVFAVSFLLAFLLFAVQPMATKMVLPSLGGTPAVWNTAMFTFQTLLLVGYGYAHLLATHVARRWQWLLHGGVALLSLTALPLAVTLATSPTMLEDPIPYLIAAFVVQLGLPFVLLSATQPLLQAWLARSSHPLAATPYVLYSASNLGSFAGLIGYVAVVEPLLGLDGQSVGWSAVYILGIALLLVTGYRLSRYAAAPVVEVAHEKSDWRSMALWVFLAFLPSSLSLGVTSYITTDIASVPLLWVLGLALYLLSFVDAFRTRPILVKYCQRLAPLMGMAALILYGLQGHRFVFGFPYQLLTFAALAFALHGWLAKAKPAAAQLTQFYLCLSFGGALGGLFNGLVAPLLFNETFEYPIMLLVASLTGIILQQCGAGEGWVRRELLAALKVTVIVCVLTVLCYLSFAVIGNAEDLRAINSSTLMMSASFAAMISLVLNRGYVRAFYACGAVTIIMLLAMAHGVVGYKTLFKERNFFGVERIYQRQLPAMRYMMHDTTLHGLEALDPKTHTTPLAYYSGVGEVFSTLPALHKGPMAVVGLGVGSMKCHAVAGQQVDFFEINPLVKRLAENTDFFTQLRDCPGTYRVILGDGRIRLAQEPDGKYNALVLDAFSSDAIPAHLLTHEAMQLYLSKLAPGGVLLMHTTNRHINLWPLIGGHADALGVQAYGKFYQQVTRDPLKFSNFWVVVANKPADLEPLVDDESWVRLHGDGNRPWTDRYTNIFPYFKALR